MARDILTNWSGSTGVQAAKQATRLRHLYNLGANGHVSPTLAAPPVRMGFLLTSVHPTHPAQV
eukprot:6944467-Pyramimonas_sp.AAC.1